MCNIRKSVTLFDTSRLSFTLTRLTDTESNLFRSRQHPNEFITFIFEIIFVRRYSVPNTLHCLKLDSKNFTKTRRLNGGENFYYNIGGSLNSTKMSALVSLWRCIYVLKF